VPRSLPSDFYVRLKDKIRKNFRLNKNMKQMKNTTVIGRGCARLPLAIEFGKKHPALGLYIN
jgi:hypothetical protein